MIAILFLTFSSFSLFLFSNSYKDWERDFKNSEILFLDFKNEEVDLEKKIQEYNKVKTEYAFIEFNKKEALFLFSNSFEQSLPNWIGVEKTALETSRGSWNFFVKTHIGNISMPWFKISILKKDFQSVNIYIDDIFLGNISLKSLNLNSVVENSNSGLHRAIQLVNDGNFAGRVFENIELGEETLVIKSRNIGW